MEGVVDDVVEVHAEAVPLDHGEFGLVSASCLAVPKYAADRIDVGIAAASRRFMQNSGEVCRNSGRALTALAAISKLSIWCR